MLYIADAFHFEDNPKTNRRYQAVWNVRGIHEILLYVTVTLAFLPF